MLSYLNNKYKTKQQRETLFDRIVGTLALIGFTSYIIFEFRLDIVHFIPITIIIYLLWRGMINVVKSVVSWVHDGTDEFSI